mgnify:CR=1 FL=1
MKVGKTNFIERYFGIRASGSNIRTEILAGLTTFFAMSYILFINPSVLAKAGMEWGAVFLATIIASVIGTLVMGLVANVPYAQAPGMGLNAFFTYSVCLTMHISWKVALTAVFVEGADGFDLSGAFRVFEMLGEELVGTSIRLNPDGEVLVDGEVVSVRPCIGGSFLSDDGFSVSVKTIPGLTYELKRASEPNGAFESVDVAVPATSGHTTLSDAQPPDGKAFYRVNLVWEEE